MAKYEALARRLRWAGDRSVQVSFDELDLLLPGGLPAPARTHQTWWANEPAGTRHVQARGWLSIGRRVERVDLINHLVQFSAPTDEARRPSVPSKGGDDEAAYAVHMDVALPPTEGALRERVRRRRREAVYAAQDRVWEELVDRGIVDDDDDDLVMEEVRDYMAAAAAAAGWNLDVSVEVDYDLTDEDEYAGWVDDSGIHLNPRILRRWIVLHELAHVLDQTESGHGPPFCANHVLLVGAVLGPEAGETLAAGYADCGLYIG